jgi:hypothetical protein
MGREGKTRILTPQRNNVSFLCGDEKAKALVKSLPAPSRSDLLRTAHLPLLLSDEEHVAEDLKGIQKGHALGPVLLVRGDIANGLPLISADSYHRICAVCYSMRVRLFPAELSRLPPPWQPDDHVAIAVTWPAQHFQPDSYFAAFISTRMP